jgi:hypothetical protein
MSRNDQAFFYSNSFIAGLFLQILYFSADAGIVPVCTDVFRIYRTGVEETRTGKGLMAVN